MRRISQLFCHGVIALVAWSSALTYADAAVSHGGVLTDYEASYNEGLAKYERGDYPGAIADFTTALEHPPHFAAAYRGRGFARYHEQDAPGAIADFQDAARLEDSEAKEWLAKNGYQW